MESGGCKSTLRAEEASRAAEGEVSYGMSKAPKKAAAKAPAKNENPKGHKVTAKTARAVAHKAPERRNENKVRGR